MTIQQLIDSLHRGDFSALEPVFTETTSGGESRREILEWCRHGLFQSDPVALAEAFTCACFLGQTDVVRELLMLGVDPAKGAGAGQSGFHCAAGRGHLSVVKLLIEFRAPLEARNQYGGTVLGQALWSAEHDPRPDHGRIAKALVDAGASVLAAGGQEHVAAVLARYGIDR